jgi:glycosyltransferase involved in cell wall biosynthesis
VGDVEALTKALGDLLADPERRRAFGIESREVVKKYSYEAGRQAILAVLTK